MDGKRYFDFTVRVWVGSTFFDLDIEGWQSMIEPEEVIITHVDGHKDIIDYYKDDFANRIYEAVIERLDDE